jgi:hypothetical protein
MKVIAPQHADVSLVFPVKLNTAEDLDLTAVDDIVLAIAKSSPSSVPVAVLAKSTMPGRFAINNVADIDGFKKVTVAVLASDLGNQAGLFYMSLYIHSIGKVLTHNDPHILDVHKTVREA